MSQKSKIKPKRIGFMPKLRAATMGDRRTKRNRTRAEQKRRAIREFA